MAWYHIAHIMPNGNVATLAHADIVRLLQYSFESLGHQVTTQINQAHINATNIIVGYERLNKQTLPSALRYIPYQLEQLGDGGHPFTDNMLHVLQHAAEIWDYAPSNVDFLHQQGLTNIKMLPIGHHPKLATIPHTTEDIDVLCYGLMSDRRLHVLKQLESKCKVRKLQYIYGLERDALISRSKITLNLHHYLTKLGEQVRVSYLLNNARCVVSEVSTFDPLAPYCATVPYENLAEKCLELLANDAERHRIAETGAAEFAKYPMVDYLKQVLPA